jgi:hypothetical protein
MSQKRPSTWGNPDHRRQTQLPAPPIAQIEQQLFSLLNPGQLGTPRRQPPMTKPLLMTC